MTEDAPQRRHDLREVFNGLRWIVRTGAPWRYAAPRPAALAGGLPADPALAGGRASSRRWCTTCASCCAGRRARGPTRRRRSWTAPRCNSTPGERRTAPATTGTSGARARKVHAAVDTLGHLLALLVTPADDQDRAQVGALAEAVQAATGETVEVAFVDQGYTGDAAGRGGRRARHPAGGRQAAGGQARLRAAAPALGRGALLRLGGALPPPGQGLRTLARNGRRACISWPSSA